MTSPVRYGKTFTRVHDPLVWREAADFLLREAAVQVFLHTVVTEVLVEGGERVAGVVAYTKQGKLSVRARITIDASGDADVVAMTGLPAFIGQQGKVQNPTMIFRLPGVDVARFLAAYGPDSIMGEEITRKIVRLNGSGEYFLPRAKIFALGSELVARLAGELRHLDRDAQVGAIVLGGAPPGFCAGSDLKELAAMNLDEMCEHEAETAAFARSIALLSKPVIAAVEGFALGGGFALAAACDLVVTSATCRWHLPEVKIGWIPPWGLEPLTARVGPAAARRLTWGSEPIDGTAAYRLGVADYLAAEGAVLKEAIDLGRRLAALPAPAVAATKRYYAGSTVGAAESRDAEANRLFAENCRHEAAQATLSKYGKFVTSAEQITYPVSQGVAERGQKAMLITERAVFRVERDGLVLIEVAKGVDVRRDVLARMEFQPKRIAEPLALMDETLFSDSEDHQRENAAVAR